MARQIWSEEKARKKGYIDRADAAQMLREQADIIENGPSDELVKLHLQVWLRQIEYPPQSFAD